MKHLWITIVLTFSINVNAKVLNISANPIAFVLDVGGYVAADFGVSKHLMLGAEYSFIDYEDDFFGSTTTVEATGYALRVGYYFEETFKSSWYLRALLGYIDIKETSTMPGIFGGDPNTSTIEGDGPAYGVIGSYLVVFRVLSI